MSVHKFNEPFHKFRTLIQHLLSPFTHSYRNKITPAIPAKAKPKIVLMDLTGMVANLDAQIRVPFEMYYLGHQYHEIAHILEVPLNTVKSNIRIARKELKAKIDARYSQKSPKGVLTILPM